MLSIGFQDRSRLNEQSTSRDTALLDTNVADDDECSGDGGDREHRMQLTIPLRPAAPIAFLASTSTLVLLRSMHSIQDVTLVLELLIIITRIPLVQQCHLSSHHCVPSPSMLLPAALQIVCNMQHLLKSVKLVFWKVLMQFEPSIPSLQALRSTCCRGVDTHSCIAGGAASVGNIRATATIGALSARAYCGKIE